MVDFLFVKQTFVDYVEGKLNFMYDSLYVFFFLSCCSFLSQLCCYMVIVIGNENRNVLRI
jgi:hypothetical protein